MSKQSKQKPKLKRDQKQAFKASSDRIIFTNFSQISGQCKICFTIVPAGVDLCPIHRHPVFPCFCGNLPEQGMMLCNDHRTAPKGGTRIQKDYEVEVGRHIERAIRIAGLFPIYKESLRYLSQVFVEELAQLEGREDFVLPTLNPDEIIGNARALRELINEFRQHTAFMSRRCQCSPSCDKFLPRGAPKNQRYFKNAREDHRGRARIRRFRSLRDLATTSK